MTSWKKKKHENPFANTLRRRISRAAGSHNNIIVYILYYIRVVLYNIRIIMRVYLAIVYRPIKSLEKVTFEKGRDFHREIQFTL